MQQAPDVIHDVAAAEAVFAQLSRAFGTPGTAPSSDFDLNPGVVRPNRAPRPAAVLVPLVARAGGPRVVLTRRAAHLRNHPGQIAFPGGRIDPDDAGPWHAALREAQEEIGLPASAVRPLGKLPVHHTVTAFVVEPHVAVVDPSARLVPAEAEVAEVFEVPLAFLLNPAHYQVQERMWQGLRRRYYAVPYGPHYIWGATARMLRVMADLAQRG